MTNETVTISKSKLVEIRDMLKEVAERLVELSK